MPASHPYRLLYASSFSPVGDSFSRNLTLGTTLPMCRSMLEEAVDLSSLLPEDVCQTTDKWHLIKLLREAVACKESHNFEKAQLSWVWVEPRSSSSTTLGLWVLSEQTTPSHHSPRLPKISSIPWVHLLLLLFSLWLSWSINVPWK